ncbi:MAG: hypothetical protein ACLFV3_06820 [Phycisphaeraceae bacterium]
MALTVHSPYSGKLVKVRDEDVGRAIRDEEGRVFYVVKRSEGEGYYAAPTRQGSPRDEALYDDMVAKAEAGETTADRQQTPAIHDATGPGQPLAAWRVLAFVLVLLVILFVLAWTAYQYWMPGLIDTAEPQEPTQPGLVEPEQAPAEQIEPRQETPEPTSWREGETFWPAAA